jgi:hypothetical protein
MKELSIKKLITQSILDTSIRMNKKILVMVATLGLVLTVGELATIYSQQAFAKTFPCTSPRVCGGNGGNGGVGGNGGTCTTINCSASGGSGNGGLGQNSNGGQGANGGVGGNGLNGGQGTNGGNNNGCNGADPSC